MTDESLRRSIRAIGLFYYFGAMLNLSASIMCPLLLLGGEQSILDGRTFFGLAVFFGIGVGLFLVGRGLRQFRRWARTVAMVLCGIALIGAPIGTIMGCAFLYVLIKAEHLFPRASASAQEVVNMPAPYQDSNR